MLFAGVFVVVAVIALVIYLVDQAGQWSIGWAGNEPARHCHWRAVVTLAEELSKKPFRRPRSETATVIALAWVRAKEQGRRGDFIRGLPASLQTVSRNAASCFFGRPRPGVRRALCQDLLTF